MEFKTRFITKDEFKLYFGIDLEIELPESDNSSDRVNAFLCRIENLLEAWINTNYFYRLNTFWETFTDYQKEQYKLALLEQAYYVLKNGDISSDSGYDKDKGIVADRRSLNVIAISPATYNHLDNGGFLNKHIYKKGTGTINAMSDTYAIQTQQVIQQKGDPGKDGLTPFIADNGNWWLGGVDTGVKAQAKDGAKGDTGLGFVAIFNQSVENWLTSNMFSNDTIKNYLILYSGWHGDKKIEIIDNENQQTTTLTGDELVGKVLTLQLTTQKIYIRLNGVLQKEYEIPSFYFYIDLTLTNIKLLELA